MTLIEMLDETLHESLHGAAFLRSLAGAPVTVVGAPGEAALAARTLADGGADVDVVSPSAAGDLGQRALVVVTSAAGLHVPAVAAARAAGVSILGDLDVAWLASGAEAFAFAVTGNAHRAAALTVTMLGAHTRAVLSLGADPGASVHAADTLVVAPLVDQLHAMQVFRPRVAVVLRGAPTAASRLFARQVERDCVVMTDDASLRSLARATRAPVVWLGTRAPLEHGVYVSRGRIVARLNGHVEDVGPVAGIPAVWLESVLAAVACALWAGLGAPAIGATLGRAFPHDGGADHARARPGRARQFHRRRTDLGVRAFFERAFAMLALPGRRQGSAT